MRPPAVIAAAAATLILTLPAAPAAAWELKDLFDTWLPMATADNGELMTVTPHALTWEDGFRIDGTFKEIGENRYLFVRNDHLEHPGSCQYRVFSFVELQPYETRLDEKQICIKMYDQFNGQNVQGSWCMMVHFSKPRPDGPLFWLYK